MKLYGFQQRELDEVKDLSHVAFYHDMGLGKTFTGVEGFLNEEHCYRTAYTER